MVWRMACGTSKTRQHLLGPAHAGKEALPLQKAERAAMTFQLVGFCCNRHSERIFLEMHKDMGHFANVRLLSFRSQWKDFKGLSLVSKFLLFIRTPVILD